MLAKERDVREEMERENKETVVKLMEDSATERESLLAWLEQERSQLEVGFAAGCQYDDA